MGRRNSSEGCECISREVERGREQFLGALREEFEKSLRSNWLDRMWLDMEESGYTSRAFDIPACSVNSPQQRNRLYWVSVADSDSSGCARRQEAQEWETQERTFVEWSHSNFWEESEWRICADGRERRIKPGVRLLVDGIPNRVGILSIAGNAIVPPLAAEVIRAFLETEER
jgi:hypothetical protein